MKYQKLKNVLWANALFSFISGLDLIIFNDQIKDLFGLKSGTLFYIIGIGLILFSLNVIYVALKKYDHRKQVLSISYADFGWVLGSVFILLSSAVSISVAGKWIIGIIAVIVFLFGFLQLKFSR